jgi:glucose/arabinose dehydrogenase
LENRPLELRVNGVVDQAALAFNPTGAWTTWSETTEPITLAAGANTIRLTIIGAAGPNVDHITLAFVGIVLTPPDAAPSGLTANVVSSNLINLFWSDNATNETEYQVERRLASGGSFSLIATLPANATAFSSTGLAANTQYVYRVRAANSAGQSEYSNEANATTLPTGSTTPSVTSVNPGPGATGVFLDRDIVATVSVPNGGVDDATLTGATVRIYPTGDPGSPVTAVLNTSGGGDIIVARPSSNLLPNTSYTFEVTSGVKDVSGVAFAPFTSTFTTGTLTSPVDTSIQFQRVTLANVPIGQYSSLAIGPDGKLYASGVSGDLFRWEILADGTLGPRTELPAFRAHTGEDRLLLGIEFDPAASADNLILWTTHSDFAFSNSENFTGTITRLSGPNLETVQDVVVHLPRSFGDHATNQMDFGPDGKLYFLQGSQTAMGAPDSAWGFRDETLLSGAVLRFDPALWDAGASGPLDVHTEDADPYNPFAPEAPLTIYATGVRNAYDLAWHSNGQLYVPTNGSAAGGRTPATPAIPPEGLLPRIDSATNGAYMGPAVPGLTGVSTQRDWLFRIEQNGYYGHPNPTRNEFVLNGGNPTGGVDPGQVSEYPVGTLPDRNWRGAAFDFGTNRSPNGVIEYKHGGFGGALVGKLIVVRFSSGDDLIVLEPGLDGNIVASNDAIASFDGFDDPLDLVENSTNGYLYVSQYDWAAGMGTITLLRPQEPNAAPSGEQLVFDEVRGGAASAPKTLTVFNTGTGALSVTGLSITGPAAALFNITPGISLPATVPAGGSLNVNVTFNPTGATPLGPTSATLRLTSNDPDQPTIDFFLGGLVTPGEEGSNEPSLQWILDTFRIPIEVNDGNEATAPIEGIVLPNALNIPRFVKAGPGAVTFEVLAAFVGDSGSQPAGFIGWYQTPATLVELMQLGSGDSGQHQELNPTIGGGVTSFDPGDVSFGLWSSSPTFPGRVVYSEDALNTWDAGKQKHLVYPLLDIAGAVVPNAYLVGTEEATNNDFQDYLYIIRNVKPQGPPTGDFDEDDDVDGHDFMAWQRGLGATTGATRAAGDANFDGAVNGADLAVWQAQFGSSIGAAAARETAIAAAVMRADEDDATPVGEESSPGILWGRRPATDLVDAVHARSSSLGLVNRAAALRPHACLEFATIARVRGDLDEPYHNAERGVGTAPTDGEALAESVRTADEFFASLSAFAGSELVE